MSNPAWESDPTTRHQYRWWDGEKWTDYVADDGVQSMDPLTGAESLKPPKIRTIPPAPSPASPTDQNTFTSQQPYELASRVARLGARLIDSVIFMAFTAGLLFALHFTDVKPIPIDELSDSDTIEDFFEYFQDYFESLDDVGWGLVIAAAVYEIAFIAMKGQTPGKMATRIQVVRAEDLSQPEWGRPPGWGRSLIRWALPFLLGLPERFIPYAGNILVLFCYLSLTWDRDRQGWHDKAARTLVIQKR